MEKIRIKIGEKRMKKRFRINPAKFGYFTWEKKIPPNAIIQFKAKEVVKILDCLDDVGIHLLLSKKAPKLLVRVDKMSEFVSRRFYGNEYYAMVRAAIENSIKKVEK